MASILTHALLALALGKTVTSRPMPARFWVAGAACAMLPDADAVGFWMGVPYDHLLGHRGLSHSLAFAAVLAVGATRLCFGAVPPFARLWWQLAAYFFACTASHGLLDMCTNGG